MGLEAEVGRAGGLINGRGATLLSGRVRVFPRRMVAPESGGCLEVGIGTSLTGWSAWKRRAMGRKDCGVGTAAATKRYSESQACC